MMKAKSKFDYEKFVPGFDNSADPSLTMQQFAQECDINWIMSHYEQGIVSPASVSAQPAQPMFGDFSEVPKDLTEYYERFNTLVSTFDTLPLEVKKACNYDPHKLLEIVQNPEYHDFLVAQGLVVSDSKTEGEGSPQGGSSTVVESASENNNQ